MSDKLCGTCKWFGGLLRKDHMGEHWPEPSEKYSFGRCKFIKINRLPYNYGSTNEPDCLAFTTDAEEYSTALMVRPQFGCVLHEPKPPEDHPADD
jgi:hypothetical protein